MDTMTQITLGAAVGELTLGKKVGNKAILWGGVAGMIPDLDILGAPFFDTVSRMTFHRGFSHSIAFALLFAPLLAYFIFKIYRGNQASWKDWSRLCFWSLVTHPLLDCFTSYGTQLFWPLSSYRVALNSIFVIDPLYSTPLALTIIVMLFLQRASQKRRVINYLGLGISTLYLFLTIANKLYVTSVFETQLQAQNIPYYRILTAPTPLNNLLWRCVAEDQEGFWEGYYSLLDRQKNIQFSYTPKNHHLITSLQKYKEIQMLIHLTKGFYNITRKEGSLYLNDMRYGEAHGWLEKTGEYVFSFKISRVPFDRVQVHRQRPNLKLNRMILHLFIRRILGN